LVREIGCVNRVAVLSRDKTDVPCGGGSNNNNNNTKIYNAHM